ncbi:helix-turn-helix domain-containing protein [Vibrio ostreicida]|uniref:helix-turn-helix domain-containing protein n=1 Tax=Vibrio ostreicida TaxID=526588 RepID=UPI0009714789|nr:helix-turn-helix transcriptional regulator [Vibrio ostreicida]NPD07689.1 helix-turn-helix transcriptional regulator [Vibrio ostreicida]
MKGQYQQKTHRIRWTNDPRIWRRDSRTNQAQVDDETIAVYLASYRCATRAFQPQAALANQITRQLYQTLGDFPLMEEIAAQYGCSLRTLRRLLTDEGTNYQRLLDQVRRQLASEFLSATKQTVEQIAQNMGFSDTANFRRSFKRWTGTTPSQFRKRHSPSCTLPA